MSNLRAIDEYRSTRSLPECYPWLRELLTAIETEVDERFLELPVDADGVPIHVDDELESGEYSGKRFACLGYCYNPAGYERPMWSVAMEYSEEHGETQFTMAHRCRHVKPRTVEDVLYDVMDAFAADVDSVDEIAAKYASELRMAE